MKTALFFLLFLAASIGVNAQNLNCTELENFTPTFDSPILHVKVNCHFIYHSDPNEPGNFTEFSDGLNNITGKTGVDFANDVINTVNQRLSGNPQVNMPPNNDLPLTPRGYRLSLKGVHFHESDQYYDEFGTSVLMSNFGVNVGSEINIWFMGNNCTNFNGGFSNMDPFLGFGGYFVYVDGIWDHLCVFGNYDNTVWEASWNIMHETGHNLGLLHPLQESLGGGDCCETDDCGDDCEDTPSRQSIIDEFGFDPCCSDPNDPQCCNNMMSYARGTSCTPCQLSRIRFKLLSEMLDYLDKDLHCSRDPNSDLEIQSGEHLTFEETTVMQGNIVITSGGSLRVRCTLFMPSDARIIVEPGGKLEIQGGEITTFCDDLWLGVEIWGNSSLPQTNINQGFIESNGGSISHAHAAIWVRQNDPDCNLIPSGSGGIAKMRDFHFYNNYNGVVFGPYMEEDNEGNFSFNQSYFHNCVFENFGDLKGEVIAFNSFLYVDGVFGLDIIGCDFINDTDTDFCPSYPRGTGVI